MRDKAEKIIFVCVLFGLIYIPILAAALAVPDGYTFTGHFSGGYDFYTFLTKIKWGYDGHWLYENRYTPGPSQPVPIYLFYLCIGHIAKLLGITPVAAFLLAGFVMAVAAFTLLLHVLRNESIHSLIFAVFAFPNTYIAIRFAAKLFHLPEEAVYLYPSAMSFFIFPHYAADFIGFILVLWGAKDGLAKKGLAKGICGTYVLLLIHPFLLAPAYLIPFLYALLFRRDKIKQTILYSLIIGLAGSPYLFVLAKDFLTVPWLITWRSQAVAQHSLTMLFVSYGFPFVAAIIYLVYLVVKRKSKTAGIWIAWLAGETVLAVFMPMTNKNEFLFGLSIPIAVLAGRSIGRIDRIKPRLLSYTLSLAMVSFNLMFAVFPAAAITDNKQDYADIYLPDDYIAGFESMSGEGTVLSRSDTGNLVPYYSGLKPFVGHKAETADFRQKKETADAFFSGDLPEHEIDALIKDYNIRYVVVDKYLYNDAKPAYKGLTQVMSNEHIEVYCTTLRQ